MKHYDVLTLRWSNITWSTFIKEPMEEYWLQPTACRLKYFKMHAETFISYQVGI